MGRNAAKASTCPADVAATGSTASTTTGPPCRPTPTPSPSRPRRGAGHPDRAADLRAAPPRAASSSTAAARPHRAAPPAPASSTSSPSTGAAHVLDRAPRSCTPLTDRPDRTRRSEELTMTDNTCGLCSATVKGAFVCEHCGDGYANDLKALVEWLHEELETTMAGTKGATAPEFRGSKASAPPRSACASTGAPPSSTAACTAPCATPSTTASRSAPPQVAPQRRPRPHRLAMALWLTWRVDGLCLDPKGPRHGRRAGPPRRARQEIVAWEPPERRFLGPCEVCGAATSTPRARPRRRSATAARRPSRPRPGVPSCSPGWTTS
jgi:hypothetical protein